MKRFFSALLMCVLVLGCGTSALAATDGVSRASDILRTCSASVATGDNSGELKIKYTSYTGQSVDTIGVSSIVIYKSDGSYVTTITGSKSNGLLASNVMSKNGTYIYKGTSGVYYKASVTLTAKAGGSSDYRTVTTGTARAK